MAAPPAPTPPPPPTPPTPPAAAAAHEAVVEAAAAEAVVTVTVPTARADGGGGGEEAEERQPTVAVAVPPPPRVMAAAAATPQEVVALPPAAHAPVATATAPAADVPPQAANDRIPTKTRAMAAAVAKAAGPPAAPAATEASPSPKQHEPMTLHAGRYSPKADGVILAPPPLGCVTGAGLGGGGAGMYDASWDAPLIERQRPVDLRDRFPSLPHIPSPAAARPRPLSPKAVKPLSWRGPSPLSWSCPTKLRGLCSGQQTLSSVLAKARAAVAEADAPVLSPPPRRGERPQRRRLLPGLASTEDAEGGGAFAMMHAKPSPLLSALSEPTATRRLTRPRPPRPMQDDRPTLAADLWGAKKPTDAAFVTFWQGVANNYTSRIAQRRE